MINGEEYIEENSERFGTTAHLTVPSSRTEGIDRPGSLEIGLEDSASVLEPKWHSKSWISPGAESFGLRKLEVAYGAQRYLNIIKLYN